MILRFWHFLTKHNWKDRISKVGPAEFGYYQSLEDLESAKQAQKGFTELNRVCDCGAWKRYRFIGDADLKHSDIEELRRICQLP